MIFGTKLLQHLELVSFIGILVKDSQHSHNFHYKTVFLYIESNDPVASDVSEHIVQTLSYVPVILRDYNQPHQARIHSYGEQNLNIILINNRSSITFIETISNNLIASDDKIIALLNDPDASLPYSPGFLQTVNFLHRFVLIGTDSIMVAFRLFRMTFNIEAYTVDMFDRDSVISHFQKVYGHGLLSLNGTSVRVFLRYIPPWSLICPTDITKRFYKSLGRDALVTEIILFSLNATITITSDLAISEPHYADWFTLNGSNSLRVMWLHREIFSETRITEFYARYV